MPSSIPYNHPSLVIGNIVDTRVLGLLKKIDGCQAKIDAAQDKLNSLILMKRSIAMTLNELADMDVDVSPLSEQQEGLDSSIRSAAADYLSARIENETDIQQLRVQLGDLEVQENMESPVDFSASVLKTLPLSAESVKLDSQYFSFASNMQDDTIANVEKFIRASTSNLGDKSEEVTSAVSSQINNQLQNHSIAGTLIVTASCTHSDVKIFEPLVVDPDKAVSAWNAVNGKQSVINTFALKSAEEETANNGGEDDQNALTLITGASYGSSFVGMVHILNSSSSMSGNIEQLKSKLDDKLKIGGWINNANGGFGIDDSVMKDVQALLSAQSFSCHVSAVVMGALPSMSSGKLNSGIKKLGELEINVAALQDSSGEGIETISSDAEKARAGARVITAQNMKLKAMMKSLSEMDQLANNMLDVNSLMSAFDNYLSAIANKDGKTGVPISFYIKKLTKSSIEKMWRNKYYPAQQESKEAGPAK